MFTKMFYSFNKSRRVSGIWPSFQNLMARSSLILARGIKWISCQWSRLRKKPWLFWYLYKLSAAPSSVSNFRASSPQQTRHHAELSIVTHDVLRGRQIYLRSRTGRVIRFSYMATIWRVKIAILGHGYQFRATDNQATSPVPIADSGLRSMSEAQNAMYPTKSIQHK